MVAKQFIETGKHPLHDGKLHSKNIAFVAAVINPRVKDIKILVYKIIYVGLGFSLPPHMVPNKVFIEYMQMHKQAQQRDEQVKKQLSLSADFINKQW